MINNLVVDYKQTNFIGICYYYFIHFLIVAIFNLRIAIINSFQQTKQNFIHLINYFIKNYRFLFQLFIHARLNPHNNKKSS